MASHFAHGVQHKALLLLMRIPGSLSMHRRMDGANSSSRRPALGTLLSPLVRIELIRALTNGDP